MNARPQRAFDSSMQLIAVCPLLAMSDTVVDALGLSVALLLVMPLATMLLVFIRSQLTGETALAASMLTLAALAACVELLMSAWLSELRQSLGLFVPLMVSNLILIDHLQTRHDKRRAALLGSLKIGAGISVTLLLLSIARELVGRGSLLHDAGKLFGSWAAAAEMNVFRVDMGFLLAMLPPGAFISFGLLLAARNWLALKNNRNRT